MTYETFPLRRSLLDPGSTLLLIQQRHAIFIRNERSSSSFLGGDSRGDSVRDDQEHPGKQCHGTISL